MVGASVAGTSHVAVGQACQDDHAAEIVSAGGDTVALLAVADGAGSAAASRFGAQTAVDAALRALRAAFERDGRAGLCTDWLRDAVADARASVYQAADQYGHVPQEYSCTLLLAVVAPQRTLAAHVGDGAIVVEDDALRVLSFPEQGEYANVTRFLVDSDALDAVRVCDHGPVRRIALLTDGLQALALDYATATAFSPFFDPIFSHVERTNDAREETDAQLAGWLDSPAVNERTDDDKTLLIAVRTVA